MTGVLGALIASAIKPEPVFSNQNLGTGANNTVEVIRKQADGKILIGGSFTLFNNITTNRLVRLNPDGTIDTSFSTNLGTGFGSTVRDLAIQPDGKIIVVGNFLSFNGALGLGRVVRLNPDGTRDTSFSVGSGANGEVLTVAIQSNGKILIAGMFERWADVVVGAELGEDFVAMIQLNSNGSRVTTYDTRNIGDEWPNNILLQSDGKAIVTGYFDTFKSNSLQRYIVRLNADSSIVDTGYAVTFSNAVNNSIVTSIIQPDGKVVAGGVFTSHTNISANRITRFNADGTRDSAFITNIGTGANNTVTSLSLQSDGKIMVAGSFTTWNGATVPRIVRLNPDGTRDTSYTPSLGTGVNLGTEVRPKASLDMGGGKTLIGGSFTIFNGVTVNRITQISA